MKIPTKDSDGRYNGYLIEIWSELERPDLRPSQVYLTAVAPHSRKGPHLHKVRRGLFRCIQGTVFIRTRDAEGNYQNRFAGELPGYEGEHGSKLIEVPPGISCAIYNPSDEFALVINLPAPAWSKEQPDDWPVENWIDQDWYEPYQKAA